MQIESSVRSFAKAASWRTLGVIVTTLTAYALTHKWEAALLIGGADSVLKIILYFGHERLWVRIPFGRRQRRSGVIWLTGLSGAGKSTVAKVLSEKLQKRGYKTEELDGDAIREIFPATGFSRPERDQHIRRVGYVASRIESHGAVVIASLISPFEESRQFVKGLCKNYFEVHVATPLEICESRDPKGLYKKARAGLLPSFTGIDDPYEAPKSPHLKLNTDELSPEESAELILKNFLKEEEYSEKWYPNI